MHFDIVQNNLDFVSFCDVNVSLEKYWIIKVVFVISNELKSQYSNPPTYGMCQELCSYNKIFIILNLSDVKPRWVWKYYCKYRQWIVGDFFYIQGFFPKMKSW